ncbi:MAG TPA: AMP-binding protein [Solirubrobacterales bacterium]|nr:AMP-binding protein [Solirubrobacterales bacterium]
MIYHSPEPEIEIPEVTLTEHVLGGANARGDHRAFIDGATGEAMTYAELAARVDDVAAWLQSKGIAKGDVVGLTGPNSAAWGIVYHGILRAGAVVTPMNPLLTQEEIRKQQTNAGAELLIDEPVNAVAEAPQGGTAKPVDVGPEDVAVLPYSSGTTGLMKGVMLTHRNLVANIEQAWSSMPLGPDDTLVGLLPYFHIYGQTVVLNLGLAKGSTIVNMARFDLDRLLEICETYGVTWLHVAPPVILALATAPQVEGRDLSKLKLVISGAAPLDADLAGRAEERIGAPIRQGYGMTELSPVSHKSRLARVAETPPGSIGALIPNTEARLVDPETGEDVAEGEEGEVWIRGPQVMKGYLNNPEADAEIFAGDGWLRTGDIGRVDENGFFYIVDRLKELIKYKGYQVAPAELEAVLVSHPKVKDAGVIGVRMEEGEEIPKACVVCDGDLDSDELIAYVSERVAPYKRVREVEFVDEVPKSASGKILRRVLRDQYGAARAAS